VAVIGAGGLGGTFVWGAVKKGIGEITIYDGDDVAVSNLNRQFFTPRDLGKNKALRLGRNASRAGFMGTRLLAVPHFFQAALELGLAPPCDVVFCGPDNDPTRIFVARHFLNTPVIFAAVSRDAGHGYVAVQEPGQACFACFRPQALQPETAVRRTEGACPVDPAVVDVLGVVAMVSLYCLDSLFMNRPRHWNFKQVALHGAFPDISAQVPRRPDCPLCTRATKAPHGG
jgi:adenylyltransferase/sulfurtransferase